MYRFVAIRTHDDEDGLLYPVFSGPEHGLIFELEADDYTDIVRVPVVGLFVREGAATNRPVISATDINLDCSRDSGVRLPVSAEKASSTGRMSVF